MRESLRQQIAPWIAYYIGRILAKTLRVKVIGEKEILASAKENGHGLIFVTWHGRTFIPITRFEKRKYWALISTSRDGDLQDKIFSYYGFNTVRGSSSARGAVQATLTLAKELKAGGILAFTPDGPRGPSQCAQPGVVYLGRKSGCPVIPVGVSAAPCKYWSSWDRYMLPKPFARGIMLYGDPIYIPNDAKSQEDQDHWAGVIGREITRLEAKADEMVGAPRPKATGAE